MKAIWKDRIIADSDEMMIVEGNHSFPGNTIKDEFFKESATHTFCGCKGTAKYYTVSVDGEENPASAWFYPSTSQAAKEIEGYVSFRRGVEIIK